MIRQKDPIGWCWRQCGKFLSVLRDVLVRNKLEGKATNLGLPGKTDTRLMASFSGTACVNWHQKG